ncbi:RNA binding S1 domain protein [Streptomyces venezuelae]|uniref:hypothetical protein n=1 Tax=Streptomyces gardneri TaxID=66892 RepID=UPI0006BC7682|nr:hypothetical protein [Streptomyces gardneri]ALO05978.1 RNA binding S1 domain protein [Streptomyces venezuelae]QPK43487.1 hypothetical protein H4W23_01820 [Streptomyces gardneri]WRK34721.1 hypothetical protein U0M97_01830 [Streptomyces venezuelae]CUM43797.1 SSU ribosomal protein S1p [Streptomyces venezuelae]
MQLAYVYRVSKHDPADRDDHGHYTGAEDITSDHGKVEATYFQAVQAFASETHVGWDQYVYADSSRPCHEALARTRGLGLFPERVLVALPSEGLVEVVWQDKDGQIHSAVADEDEFPELADLIAGADVAALLPMYADERVPLFSVVMPDRDGVVRARWRAERSLKSGRLHRPRVREVDEDAPWAPQPSVPFWKDFLG